MKRLQGERSTIRRGRGTVETSPPASLAQQLSRERGLTQEELARRASLSAASICSYEAGRKHPSLRLKGKRSGNPIALGELEAPEKVTERIDKLTVLGGLDGVLQGLVKLGNPSKGD